MEGEIINKDNSWFVRYQDYTGWGLTEEIIRETPIHPDYLSKIESMDLNNKKIKFDLIGIKNSEGDIIFNAKIIE